MKPESGNGVRNERRSFKTELFCLLIAVFVGIIYFNSLGNQFTNWDDGMIYQNPSIRNLDWNGIKKLFTLQKGNTYQPVRMLSYAIDYRIWKLNPIGYHITNIFFYILDLHHGFSYSREAFSWAARQEFSRFPLQSGCLWNAYLCGPSGACGGCNMVSGKERGSARIFLLPGLLSLPHGERRKEKRRGSTWALFFFLILLAILSKPSPSSSQGSSLYMRLPVAKKRYFIFLKTSLAFLAIDLVDVDRLYVHFDEGDD